MKIFISWSGDLSKKIAEALAEWIPTVLQSVNPYFSPNDIVKGTKWDGEIAKNLNDSSIGIICLTNENTKKPWILFEAGALSNKLEKSKVCPLLFGLNNSSLTGPLATFQTTEFKKTEFWKLIKTINDHNEIKVSDKILNKTFESFFPQLQTKIEEYLNDSNSRKIKIIERPDREILEEILVLSRRQYLNEPDNNFKYYDRNRNIKSITREEMNYVDGCIVNYIDKKGLHQVNDYKEIVVDDVFEYLIHYPKVIQICGNSENIRKVINIYKNDG